jgi:hypothetical protein
MAATSGGDTRSAPVLRRRRRPCVEPALAHVPGDVLQPLADRGRVGQGLSSRRGERRRFGGCSKRRRAAGPDGAFEARHRLQQLRDLRRAAGAVIFDQEPAAARGFITAASIAS